MDIFGIRISKDGVYNVAKREASLLDARNVAREKKEQRQQANDIRKGVVKGIFTRVAQGIKDWQNATLIAESIINPNNTELIRVYRDIEIDAHLWALMRTIQLKVISTKFFVYNASGEIDEESTKKLQQKWFRRLCLHTIDADFYGFSLVQLGDIVGGNFTGCELVPREYVVQQRGGVKKNISNPRDLIIFDEDEFKNWVLPIGERNNLGLLHKAAPLVIKKKEVISAWSEAAEVFGMPTRIGRTQINSPQHRENMEDMLENMGSAAWGVFDKDDDIQLIEGGKSDFFKIYDEFINRANSELSKLILLQTGTTDEKAFVGSAEVHEGILGDVIESYILMVEDMANEQLIPLCNRHGILPVGSYLKANNEQKFTPKETFDIVKELLKFYKVPAEWINENFEVPVEEKAEPTPTQVIADPNAKPASVMKAVKNLYEGVLTKCAH
jgi:phage gp29-like protein